MSEAWYERYTKDVTVALTRARKVTVDQAISCTLVKLRDGTHVLCSHIAASKATAMVKDARSNGGKVVSTGTLYTGEEGLTFAVTQGGLGVKKQFTAAATAAAGKAVKVTIIGVEGAETAPAESEDAETPAAVAPPVAPPAPTSDGAAAVFKERVTRLIQGVKQAVPDIQAAAQPLLVQAVGLGKAGRFAEAGPLLDQVEMRLAPPVPTPTVNDSAAAFKTRVKRLSAAVSTADAAVGAALKPVLIRAIALGQKKQFVEAEALLDQVEKELAVPTKQVETLPPSSDKDRFLEQLRAVKPRYLATMETARPDKAILAKMMTAIVQLAKESNFAKGLTTLAELEKALAVSAQPKARLAESRVRWQDARDTVGSGLTKLQGVLRNEPDPRAQSIADMGLNGVTGSMQVGLEVALLECESNPGARTKALQAIGKFRQFLTSDSRVTLCDDNPFNVTVGLRNTLIPALNDLEKALME